MTPDPAILVIHVYHYQPDTKWYWVARDGKVEYADDMKGFKTEDAAIASGESWLKRYAAATEYGRRKLLGWKINTGRAAEPQETSDAVVS